MTATLALVAPAHKQVKHHHRGYYRRHPECRTERCVRFANRAWARHHRPPKPRWVIPEYIVMCESKGTNEGPNGPLSAAGYYQIIPSTWAAYGGSPPDDASQHSKAEQDAVAARIWRDGGPSQWACA